MKVFVVTSHLEYEGNPSETWVEGVFDTLEKAQKARDDVFAKQLDKNWTDIPEDETSFSKDYLTKSLYDLVDGNLMSIRIWEKEVE